MNQRTIAFCGERMRFVLPEADDVAQIMSAIHDPDIGIFLGAHIPKIIHSSGQKDWLENKLKKENLFYMVQEIDTSQIIGMIELHEMNLWDRKGELSMLIFQEEKRGLGYGKEMTKLFLQVCFEHYGLHKVTLRVSEKNTKALGLYKSLGFQECARFREDRYVSGKWEDLIFMERLNPHTPV